MDKVTAFNSESIVWGSVVGSSANSINVSLATQDNTFLYNPSQHPGFTIHPVFYCSKPPNLTFVTEGFLFVATSAELAGALLQISMVNVSSNPEAAAAAFTVFPSTVVLDQVGGGVANWPSTPGGVHPEIWAPPQSPPYHHPYPATPNSKPLAPYPATPHSKPRAPYPATPHSKPRAPYPATPHSKPRALYPATPNSKPRALYPATPNSKPLAPRNP